MTEDPNLSALTDELRALEIETFELRDYAEEIDMHLAGACSTSSTSSTTSTTSTCA